MKYCSIRSKSIVNKCFFIFLFALIYLITWKNASASSQIAMFPFKSNIYINQISPGYVNNGYGNHSNLFSHVLEGSYVLDMGDGIPEISFKGYAPFDAYIHANGGFVVIKSKEPVILSNGSISHVFMCFAHENGGTTKWPQYPNTEMAEIKQGEHFYIEGTEGGVGAHIHFEMGLGSSIEWVNSKYWDEYGNEYLASNFKNSVNPMEYLWFDETVAFSTGYANINALKFNSAIEEKKIEWPSESNLPEDKQYWNTSVSNIGNNQTPVINGIINNTDLALSFSPEVFCFVSKFEEDIISASITDPGYTYFISCDSSFFDEPSEEYSFAFSTDQFRNIYNESPELLSNTTYYYKWVAVVEEKEIASEVMSFTMPYEANWNLHDVTDVTPTRATLSARFNIPLHASYPLIGSYKTVGCFLSKNLDDITKATPTEYNSGTVHMVSENLGSSAEGFNNGNSQYIGVSYTTEGEPSSGLGFGIKALDENDTYYYKFFGTIINDNTIYYSPTVQAFNTPDGGSISITTVASAGGDIAVDRTGKYDPGEEISLEAIPWVGGHLSSGQAAMEEIFPILKRQRQPLLCQIKTQLSWHILYIHRFIRSRLFLIPLTWVHCIAATTERWLWKHQGY